MPPFVILFIGARSKIERGRDEAWRVFDSASRDLVKQKAALLDEIAQRLEKQVEEQTLFALRWRLA